ncbi:MAG: RNA 2',3'-cyclic phosphodiesterase [Pontibacterium sp.]
MRLFIAIDPPVEVRQAISDLQFASRDIRWLPADQLHLTLAFPGEQPANCFEPLCEALCEIEFSPFTIKTQDIGCFRQGILWLGITPNAALEQLQKRTMRVLQMAGIPVENRRYHPHLTLGRCKNNPARATEHLQQRLNHQRFDFYVDRFLLKSSLLRQDGAVHRIEAEFLTG